MGFLPSNYEAPQGGNYMKLQIGENRFRVLGPAVVGNLFWTTDGEGGRKPVRRRMGEAIHDDELGMDAHGKPERVRHFWAFPVWNVTAKQVQILEVTQRTIQESILSLNESQDWGDPTGYDIIIRKSGSGLDTEYNVLPGKAEPTPTEAQREYLKANIDMDALFRGGDPFGAGDGNTTNGDGPKTIGFAEAVAECKAVGISEDDLKEHLKAKGITKQRTVEFTSAVEALIAAHAAVAAAVGEGDHQAIDSDEIPFAPDAFDGQPWKS